MDFQLRCSFSFSGFRVPQTMLLHWLFEGGGGYTGYACTQCTWIPNLLAVNGTSIAGAQCRLIRLLNRSKPCSKGALSAMESGVGDQC